MGVHYKSLESHLVFVKYFAWKKGNRCIVLKCVIYIEIQYIKQKQSLYNSNFLTSTKSTFILEHSLNSLRQAFFFFK